MYSRQNTLKLKQWRTTLWGVWWSAPHLQDAAVSIPIYAPSLPSIVFEWFGSKLFENKARTIQPNAGCSAEFVTL